MTEMSAETANAPTRRSSRISAQARPTSEAAPAAQKRARKGTASAGATGGAPKTTKGAARKRTLKDGQEEEQDEQDNAKKAKLPSTENTTADMPVDQEEVLVAEPGSSSSAAVPPSDASGNIDVGSTLPSFILKNEKGEDVDTISLTAEKGAVFFLVPKADTPGCTTQACGFRDVWEEFGALDYDVYCLSADSSAAQTKWQTKKQLPYQLLSDPQRRFIGALGAADGNKTKRSHFVFEKGGKLLDKKVPVKPADSSTLALAFIRGLN